LNSAYNELSKRQKVYIDAIREHGPTLGVDITKSTFTRKDLRPISEEFKGKPWIPNWITHDQSRRTARGEFSIPEVPVSIEVMEDPPACDAPPRPLTPDTPMATPAMEDMAVAVPA
jgi:hypothetical protein